jgi:hypothetical protein
MRCDNDQKSVVVAYIKTLNQHSFGEIEEKQKQAWTEYAVPQVRFKPATS